MKFIKDEAYYEALDKRTKEYKEWKAWHEEQSKGLGDTIAKATKATGVDKVVEKASKALGFDDCGCEDRRKKLNSVFRYRIPDCLTEDEYVWLAEWFSQSRPRVTIEEQRNMIAIYNRVFQAAQQPSNCSGCFREISKKMEKLVNAHKV
jgi:hypothetical protein